MLQNVVNKGKLKASNEPQTSDVFIICVPTPLKSNGKTDNPEPDISFIVNATEKISTVLKSGDLIILESTSPVGPLKLLKNLLMSGEGGDDLFFAHCPEKVCQDKFLKLTQNNRIMTALILKI